MDGEMNSQFRGFEDVWSRVTGEKPLRGGGDAETLRRLMDGEAEDAARYDELARRSRVAARELREMSADEREHFRHLQVEYYLLTGDSYLPPESCPLIKGVLGAMRAAYVGELKGAEEYMKAAGETERPELRELYEAHAGDERGHAATLRRIITRALG